MKRDGLKLQVWLFVILSVLLFFRIVLQSGDYNIIFRLEFQYLLSIAICGIGVFLGNAITTVLHESGHLIALKIRKCVVLEFCVLWLKVSKINKKTSISFSFKNSYNGYVSFVGSTTDKPGLSVYVSIIYAWAATVLSVVMFGVLYNFIDNYYCFCLFGGALVAALFLMLMNFLSLMPSTDGELLFNIKKNGERILSLKEAETRLYLGECLSHMSDRLFASDDLFKNGYLSYLRNLERGNFETAKNLLDKTIEDNQKTLENQPVSLDIEKFFQAILDKNQIAIDQLKDVAVSFCDREVTPTTLRIMIAYRKYTAETEWENALRRAFDGQKDFVLKGLYETEKQIINNFCG